MIKSNSIKLGVRQKLKAKAKRCVQAILPKPPTGSNKKWTMKSGKTIRIRDMDNGHLLNTIRLLERMADNEVGYAAAYAELDIGPDAYDWVNDNACTEDYFPIYHDMVAEAHRRGLDLRMPAYAANRVATPDEFEIVK